MRLMKSCLFFLFCCCSTVTAVTQDQKIHQMLRDLEAVKHTYDLTYAPLEWKAVYYNYDFEAAYQKAQNEVLSNPKIKVKQFHQIVRRFLGSFNDYHVSVLFDSTEYASLPFTVTAAEGRYYIDFVRANFSKSLKNSSRMYVPSVGDEILEFGERPIHDVIEEIMLGTGRTHHTMTDRLLAGNSLTTRLGERGDTVPYGPIKIKINSMTAGLIVIELVWDYSPETFSHPHNFVESWFPLAEVQTESVRDRLPSGVMMVYPFYATASPTNELTKSRLGDPKGFLPNLGQIVWQPKSKSKKQSSDDKKSNKTEPYHAYIYKNSDDYLVGYVRIPTFNRNDSEDLGKILNMMDKNTDILVIDELNNPGGDANYMLDVLSMLTTHDMIMPTDTFKLNYSLVRKYRQYKKEFLAELNAIAEEYSQLDKNPKMKLQKKYAAHLEEKMKIYQGYVNFFDKIFNYWNEGQITTDSLYLFDISKTTKNPAYHYSKPVIVLTNELGFSCADYFPSTLQDNGRAVIFGTRTGGAGGGVDFTVMDQTSSGIAQIAYTYALGRRANNTTIEDLGVEPDIKYEITAEDLRGGYKSYIAELDKAIRSLVIKKER